MASISGILFGFQFLPIEFLRNCDHDAFPCNGKDLDHFSYVSLYKNTPFSLPSLYQFNHNLNQFNSFKCPPVPSLTELDYVFGQYTGIFVCSTFWFILYCIIKRFKPQIYKEIIIPGIISGIMYGIATGMFERSG